MVITTTIIIASILVMIFLYCLYVSGLGLGVPLQEYSDIGAIYQEVEGYVGFRAYSELLSLGLTIEARWILGDSQNPQTLKPLNPKP